jgi:hypothetical protein
MAPCRTRASPPRALPTFGPTLDRTAEICFIDTLLSMLWPRLSDVPVRSLPSTTDLLRDYEASALLLDAVAVIYPVANLLRDEAEVPEDVLTECRYITNLCRALSPTPVLVASLGYEGLHRGPGKAASTTSDHGPGGCCECGSSRTAGRSHPWNSHRQWRGA